MSKAVLVFLVEIHTFSYQKTMDWPPPPSCDGALFIFTTFIFYHFERDKSISPYKEISDRSNTPPPPPPPSLPYWSPH